MQLKRVDRVANMEGLFQVLVSQKRQKVNCKDEGKREERNISSVSLSG